MTANAHPSPGAVPVTEAPAVPRSAFYRAVWRWHFYAGLFAIPVIVLLCLSGIVYLFRPQLDGLMYGHLRNVPVGHDQTTYQRQLDAVNEAYQGAFVVSALPPPETGRSTQFDIVTEAGDNRSVYVNPYTAQVIGSRDNDRNPVQIALLLHGSLMTGSWLGSEKWGDRFLEIVAGWSILLVVTGLILWWPRGRRRGRLRGVVVPRLRSPSTRTRWRDVHAITGVMFSFITLFFLVTGMAWTGWWGNKYQEIATNVGSTYPHQITDGVSSKTLGDLPATGKTPWASSSLPVALSGEPGGKHVHVQHHGSGIVKWDPAAGAPLDAIVTRAQILGFPPGFAIFFPFDGTGSYSITLGPDLDPAPNQSAFDERTAFVDQYTAETLDDVKFSQFGTMAKATDLGISLHEGREWGIWSQILALLGTLAILLSSATSIVMWRKRRPKGLGAPKRVASKRVTAIVVGVAAGLGVVFPLLGLSLLAVLVFDFVVLRRIKPLARALGMA
jgi:uncharacterized iron-regulated membrane protein